MPPSVSQRQSFLRNKPTAAFSPLSTTGVSGAIQKGASLSEVKRKSMIYGIVNYAKQELCSYDHASPFGKAALRAHLAYPANRFPDDTLSLYSETGPWKVEALIRSLRIIGFQCESDSPGPTAKSLTIDHLPTDIIVEAAATLSKKLRENARSYWGDGTAIDEVKDMISLASLGRVRPGLVKYQVAEHDAYLEFVSKTRSKTAQNRFFHITDEMTLVRGPDTVIGSKAYVLEVVPQYKRIWGDVESQNASANSQEYFHIRHEGSEGLSDLRDATIQADTDDARTVRLQDGEGSIIDYLGEYELYKEMDKTGKSRQELTQTDESRRLQRLAEKVVAERDETEEQYSDGQME